MIATDLHARFCRALRAARIGRGLSQCELAAKIGISQARYSAIENGRSSPTLSTVVRVAAALDADPRELLAGG